MPDSFKRFKEWLDEGSDLLEVQMEETLSDPQETEGDDKDEPEWLLSDKKFEHRSLSGSLKNIKEGTYYVSYSITAALVCLGLIGVLLFATLRMPEFGGADAMAESELTDFYVKNTLKDTGALNVVTGIILNYRGFDTLGESHVLFTAVCTVLMLLHLTGSEKYAAGESDDRHFEPKNDVILQTTAQTLIPCIFVLGAYVILNGHLSPGGGFSGGAILGSGLILYLCAFGYKKTEHFMNEKVFKAISASSLSFYTLSKGYHFITAFNGIQSFIGTGTAGAILSGGLLLPLNIAVGCIVAMTMYTLYTMFRKGDF